MPYDITTPFGTHHGGLSPEEEWGYRQQMANQQLAAQAQIAALNNQTQQNIAGTFGQRSAADMQMQMLRGQQHSGDIGLEGDQRVRAIEAGNMPAMARSALEQEQWRAGAGHRAIQDRLEGEDADWQSTINKLSMNELVPGQAVPGSAPAAGGLLAGLTPERRLAALVALRQRGGGAALPDWGMQDLEREKIQLQLKQLQEDHARALASEPGIDPAEATRIRAEGGLPRTMGQNVDEAGIAKVPELALPLQAFQEAVSAAGGVTGSENYGAVVEALQRLQNAARSIGYNPETVKAIALQIADRATKSGAVGRALYAAPFRAIHPLTEAPASKNDRLRQELGLPLQ